MTEEENYNAMSAEIKRLHKVYQEREKTIYSLLEATADIAHMAGANKFYSGDSRADIAQFITWAKQFEAKYAGEQWGEQRDYIETIDQYAANKLGL